MGQHGTGTHFSKALCAARRSAGFATAYRFIHDNGAQKLRITYRRYLLIEQGITLPDFRLLAGLINALHLIPNSAAAREMVESWLRTIAGDVQYETLIKPIMAVSRNAIATSPLHTAMENMLQRNKQHIAPVQAAVLAENYCNYLCFLILSNDSASWTPQTLAAQTGQPLDDVKRTLDAFHRVKLVKRDRRGAYRYPDPETLKEFPQMDGREHTARELKTSAERCVAGGEEIFQTLNFVRVDVNDFSNFLHIMRLNVQTSEAYSTTKKTGSSALLAVEGRVTKIMDF